MRKKHANVMGGVPSTTTNILGRNLLVKNCIQNSKFLTNVSFPAEKHSCNNCEMILPNENQLEKHMKMHENVNIVDISINVHECESCKEKFSSAGDLLFHVENNHKEAAVKFWWKMTIIYYCYLLSFLFVMFESIL